jgi:hypothetical protein
MTIEEIEELAKPGGFRPFTIVTIDGPRRAVPRPEFIDIPPLHQGEPSYVVAYTTEPGEAIVLELELDLVLDRKHEVISQRYASVRGLSKKTKQEDAKTSKSQADLRPRGSNCLFFVAKRPRMSAAILRAMFR